MLLHSGETITTDFITVIVRCALDTTVLSLPGSSQGNLDWNVNQATSLVDMKPFGLTNSQFNVCGFKGYKISITEPVLVGKGLCQNYQSVHNEIL